MHREIMKPSKDEEVDHINHDKLDNRRENLRVCTGSQNQCNRRRKLKNTSGYKGVCWYRSKNRWKAALNIKGKCVWTGLFKNKEEAAHAYDEAAKLHHGEFAYLNFPAHEGIPNGS